MNQSKENLEMIEETINAARKIKGFNDKPEDDCIQAFEDVEWMLDMDCEDWDE